MSKLNFNQYTMLQVDKSPQAIALIKMANGRGIKFTYQNDELKISLPKGALPDIELINELKLQKELIREYFKNKNSKYDTHHDKIQEAKPIIINSTQYYEITSTQLYWVNDDIDHDCKLCDPVHGTARFSLKIEGELNIKLLEKAIIFLLNRHESLRSTFHKIGNDFYMRVHETADYMEIPEIRMFDESIELNNLELLKFIDFDNHSFVLEKGSLCLIRVACIRKDLFVLSMKLHHVIVDTLAINILLRELTDTYNAFEKNEEPVLPVLYFQFKDALSYENMLKARNYITHKAYWNSVYQNFPADIFLPGNNGRKTQLAEKIVTKTNYKFKNEYYLKLLSICKNQSASLFVVLQATFKSFLFFTTGQNDILFGTTIFGRDIPGFDNQIGCFCKTVLIRTIINKTDQLKDILQKVKKSNEDLYRYNAFSLRDLLEEKMPTTHIPGSPFWIFNMQYYDERSLSGVSGISKVNTSMLSTLTNDLIPIDMQINFNHGRDLLTFQVSYDSSRFTGMAINELFDSYLTYVSTIDHL